MSTMQDEPVIDLSATPGGARGAVEAVLMVAEEPVPVHRFAQVLELPDEKVRDLLLALADEYEEQCRGFRLREVGGGWRMYSHEAYHPVVRTFVLDGQVSKLSQAALETLAVVAYRQPVSRARVSAVRGVNVDGVMRTLAVRGLVTEVGHDDDTGAVLYGTTGYFLERMGLDSLDDLPPLAPYLPDVQTAEDLAKGHA